MRKHFYGRFIIIRVINKNILMIYNIQNKYDLNIVIDKMIGWMRYFSKIKLILFELE